MNLVRAHSARLIITVICLTALLSAVGFNAGAQSGRRKPPAPDRTGKAGRPRTVNTPPAQPSTEATPTPSATPEPRVVVPAIDSDDAPPPRTWPTPVAQQASPAQVPAAKPDEIDDGDVVRVNSNLVPVPASVLDERGRAVIDLELKDFELKVDGQVRPIGDLTRSETPVALALLFDNSSSLRPTREFETKAAVSFFRRVMRPIDRAAVYSISTEPELALPLTSDVRALVRAIENFGKPEGATALFDTVAEAALYLKPHRGRKVIVIVSDGTDTISNLDFDETLARVLVADCQVYSIQTGHSDSPNLRDLAGERRLEEFAANTGGSVFAPRNAPELESAFTQIAADLAQQYVLSYYPSEERRDGSFHTITLRVATRPALRIRTRKGYYSPKG